MPSQEVMAPKPMQYGWRKGFRGIPNVRHTSNKFTFETVADTSFEIFQL